MNDPYIRAMFGEHAVQLGLNFVVQDAGLGAVSLVAVSRTGDDSPHPLRFGSELTHQLVVGDAVIRPRYVLESGRWRGVGLAGLITSSAMTSPDEWLREGKIILGEPEWAHTARRK